MPHALGAASGAVETGNGVEDTFRHPRTLGRINDEVDNSEECRYQDSDTPRANIISACIQSIDALPLIKGA